MEPPASCAAVDTGSDLKPRSDMRRNGRGFHGLVRPFGDARRCHGAYGNRGFTTQKLADISDSLLGNFCNAKPYLKLFFKLQRPVVLKRGFNPRPADILS